MIGAAARAAALPARRAHSIASAIIRAEIPTYFATAVSE